MVGLVEAIILGVGLGILLTILPWPKIKTVRKLKRSGLRWFVSFVSPFIAAYNIMPLIINISSEIMEKWFIYYGILL